MKPDRSAEIASTILMVPVALLWVLVHLPDLFRARR
jgi:hypothetical protein